VLAVIVDYTFKMCF